MVGKKLRKARENKGVSIEDVHKATRIHPKVLEALEENRLESTLGTTYVSAFLKDYARYLGLDANKLAEEYSLGHKPKIKVQKESALEPKSPLSNKKRFNTTLIAALAILVSLFILGFVTTRLARSYKSFAKNRKIAAAAKAKIELEEKTVAKRSKKSTPVEKNVKTELIPIPKSRTISLSIVTRLDVWLKVMQDGKVVFRGILAKGSKETWQAEKEITLSEIGRPEALSLNVNGKDISLSGRRIGRSVLITNKGINLDSKRKN